MHRIDIATIPFQDYSRIIDWLYDNNIIHDIEFQCVTPIQNDGIYELPKYLLLDNEEDVIIFKLTFGN